MDHMTPKDDRTPLPWAPKRTARERMRDMLSITSRQHDHDATLNTTTPDVDRPYIEHGTRGYTKLAVTPAGPVVEAGQPAQGTPQITTEPHPDAYGRQSARDLVRAMGGKLPLSEVLNADGTWTITAAGNIMDGVEVVKLAPGMPIFTSKGPTPSVVKPRTPSDRIHFDTAPTPRPDAAELLEKWGYTYEPDDTVTREQINEYLGRRGMSVDWDELNALAVDAIERAEQYSFDSDGFAVVAASTRRSSPIFAELADAWNGRLYDADDEASAYPVGPL